MTTKDTRTEILDLLARGKISIDEAVEMLDKPGAGDAVALDDSPVYKAETESAFDIDQDTRLPVEEITETDGMSKLSGMDASLSKKSRPRWLRVQVSNSETGKNKVTVNVPMAMVKFGLGIARVFTPEMSSIDLDEFGEMFNEVESGLLVDVQDDESNEHVRVIVE